MRHTGCHSSARWSAAGAIRVPPSCGSNVGGTRQAPVSPCNSRENTPRSARVASPGACRRRDPRRRDRFARRRRLQQGPAPARRPAGAGLVGARRDLAQRRARRAGQRARRRAPRRARRGGRGPPALPGRRGGRPGRGRRHAARLGVGGPAGARAGGPVRRDRRRRDPRRGSTARRSGAVRRDHRGRARARRRDPRRRLPGLLARDGHDLPPELDGVQTPQAFRAGDLLAAYAAADAEGFEGTDTAASWARYSELPVAAVPSSPTNLKVTFPEDLDLALRLSDCRERLEHPQVVDRADPASRRRRLHQLDRVAPAQLGHQRHEVGAGQPVEGGDDGRGQDDRRGHRHQLVAVHGLADDARRSRP